MSRRGAVVLVLALFSWSGARAENCNVQPTGIAFGSYNHLDPRPLDATALISWSCSNFAVPVIWLGTGQATPASFAARQLKNGTSTLLYSLYVDAARTVLWGDGTGGSSAFTASDRNGTATIYGRIFARQTSVRAGAYTDSIVVTLIF